MDKRTFNYLCGEYDKMVRSIALKALQDYGYRGVDPRPDAPSTYEQLVDTITRFDTIDSGKFFPVFDGGCENTVFTDATGNYLFRAWHDLCRYELKQDFSYADEHVVALHQADYFGKCEENEYRRICLADTIGQLNFFEYTKGGFVENQREFVYDCLTIGETAAIVKHERLQSRAGAQAALAQRLTGVAA